MEKWIIDTDAGVDDAQALVMLLSNQNIDIKAITCINGNVALDKVCTNVLEICRICDRQDVPVYRGSTRAIIQPHCDASDYHGEDGLGGYWTNHPELTKNSKKLEEIPAYQAIINLAQQYPNINVLTLGPMTNLALSLLCQPDLQIGKVVAMAGTISFDGNITPTAEYNVWQDPEAAQIVYEKCSNITMVSWETVAKLSMTHTENILNRWGNTNTQKGLFIKELLDYQASIGHIMVCDSVAAALAVDPSLIDQSYQKYVEIELEGKRRGSTVIHWDSWNLFKDLWKTPEKTVNIVDTLHYGRFWELMISSTS